jgi:hypothetical protein
MNYKIQYHVHKSLPLHLMLDQFSEHPYSKFL